MPFGYSDELWKKAKDELRIALIQCAKNKEIVSYSDLAKKTEIIKFKPNSKIFNIMLSEISKEEYSSGRGLLTALLYKTGGKTPGYRLYNIAISLGLEVSDNPEMWSNERNKVFEYWSNNDRC